MAILRAATASTALLQFQKQTCSLNPPAGFRPLPGRESFQYFLGRILKDSTVFRVCRLWKDIILTLPRKVVYMDIDIILSKYQRWAARPSSSFIPAHTWGKDVKHLIFNGRVQLSHMFLFSPLQLLEFILGYDMQPYTPHFQSLRKLTIDNLSLLFRSRSVQSLVRKLPRNVVWELRRTKLVKQCRNRLRAEEYSPPIEIPHLSGHGGKIGAMVLEASLERFLRPLNLNKEDLADAWFGWLLTTDCFFFG